jgi:hypothetical protein
MSSGCPGHLEEHVAPAPEGLLDLRGHVAQVRDEAFGHGRDRLEHGLRVQGRKAVEAGEQGVFFHQGGRDLFPQQAGSAKSPARMPMRAILSS